MDVLQEEAAQPAAERTLDGYAYHFTDKRGTWLVVAPPQGEGMPVTADLVERELQKLNLENLDWNRVRAAVGAASGGPAWILTGTDPDEEARRAAALAAEEAARPKPVDKSTYVYLTPTDDWVSVKLTLVPPEDRTIELTMDDVQKVIQDAGIVYGVQEEKLAEAEDILLRIKDGDWTEPFETEIAHGVDPEHGQDAQYDFLWEAAAEAAAARAKVEEASDGRVDYFAVKDIENIKRGTAIARRVPPTRGVAGKSTRGEEIPARDGSEGGLELGGGVEHALGNENILVAAIDGQVKFADNKLMVQALYDIPGDVDLSTGSIDFIGTVVVHGDLKPGFKIIAGEDVIVEGVVDDGEIQAAGKVTVKGGVLGQGNKAKIVANGDIKAKYIRNATIETRGLLTSDEGILHCHVSARAVKMTGKRAQIVGGEIAAEEEIVASTIGSNSSATPTILTVGESAAKRTEINELTERIKKWEEELDKLRKTLTTLTVLRERTGKLDADKTNILTMATRAKAKIENDLKPDQERLQHILAEEEEQRKHHQARISVLGTLYPGVKVQIRGAKRTIIEETRYCTLTEKGAEVKTGPYKS